MHEYRYMWRLLSCEPPTWVLETTLSSSAWAANTSIAEPALQFPQKNFLKFLFHFICMCVHACVHTHVEVRGQLTGISSLLPPRDSQGVNSYHQLGSKVPYQLSHLPASYSQLLEANRKDWLKCCWYIHIVKHYSCWPEGYPCVLIWKVFRICLSKNWSARLIYKFLSVSVYVSLVEKPSEAFWNKYLVTSSKMRLAVVNGTCFALFALFCLYLFLKCALLLVGAGGSRQSFSV